MSYTPTEWKSGDVITSEKLNNLEQGVADASSGGTGGGAYDIIFQVKSSPTGYIIPDEITISDVQIAAGSLQEVEQKLLNGERVNGLFELITSYRGNGYDTYICWQLVSVNTVYCAILFGGNAFIGDNSYDNVQIFYTSAYELDDIIFGN